MTFEFRPAVRENVGLLISFAGGTGSGKTYSAMTLAQGMAGGKPFAVIDTEARRAKHYADQFNFDHGEMKPPFRPDAYAEAIKAAGNAGYPVIVVDSASHEHAGEGGLLDWHDAELDRMAGNDWGKRERVKMAAWIKPKTSHKKFVQQLLQVRAHLILCFRAEEKVEMAKDGNGKTQIVPKKSPVGLNGWIPICEKNLPFEMTASFLLTADKPGIPHPIKLQEQHKFAFPSNKPVSQEAGQALADWAKGTNKDAGAAAPQPSQATPATGSDDQTNPPPSGHAPQLFIQGRELIECQSIDEWTDKMIQVIDAIKADNVQGFWDNNKTHMESIFQKDDYKPNVVRVEGHMENKMERDDAA